MLTLYGAAFSTYTRSCRMALAEKGQAYTLAPARLRDPAYTTLHPWRKMPVLEHDGFVVFESIALLCYIDSLPGPALLPEGPQARATTLQWMSAYNDFVNPHAVRGVLIPRFVLAARGIEVDAEGVRSSAGRARDALAVFDQRLASQPYVAGDAFTLADILLAPTVAYGKMLEGEESYTRGLTHVAAWLARVEERPSFAATTGA